jgi:hypothetical protein
MAQTEGIKKTARRHVEVGADPVQETSDFNFSNVEPDDELRSGVKGLLSRIYEHAPDGSFVRGTLKKVKSGYKGVLKICFGGGEFIVGGIQKTTGETLLLLENQIWGKIRKWRKTRFREEAT